MTPWSAAMHEGRSLNRRQLIRLGLLGVAAAPLGCLASQTEPGTETGDGRLSTKWTVPTTLLEPGHHTLGLGAGRDGYVRIPGTIQPGTAAPMALLLHGAGHDANEWTGGFPLFDQLGLIVLGVDSRGPSWDLTDGAFGGDVAFIDSALAFTFGRCNIDPARIAISGFSDGASCALSLGLTNGDLFSHVLAFSPGFMRTGGRRGRPPVFLAHGSADPILPVTFSRSLAGQLRGEGYEVVYEEFEGGHSLPYAIGARGYGWFVNGGSDS